LVRLASSAARGLATALNASAFNHEVRRLLELIQAGVFDLMAGLLTLGSWQRRL
jgi:hypothetical protein